MAARAEVLGDTGANHPDHWLGGLASPDLHAIVILFARDVAERERCAASTHRLLAQCDGVEVLSSLDLEAMPPFDYAHEHFGYRDRLSQPVIEGTGEQPTPGSGRAAQGGRVLPRLPRRKRGHRSVAATGNPVAQRQLLAYRRMQEHVGAFRDFLRAARARRATSRSSWPRSSWDAGAAAHRWCLSPDKDDPALGADPQRNNDFNYKQMDPHGYAVPLGSHMRRMNPRDTAANMKRRRMIRRGGTYGPPLPEDAPDDGSRARHRRIHDLREPHPPVRVREERVGERSEFSRARQRARSDHRHPGRHVRHSRSRSGRSGKRSRACRPSPPSGAARIFFCPASRRCDSLRTR